MSGIWKTSTARKFFSRKFRPHLFLIIILTMSVTGACGSALDSVTQSGSSATLEATVPMVDRAGNTFNKPQKTDKIICMSPAVTEILAGLGLADKIIAIDTYSAGIEGLTEDLPQFDMMTPDAERLIALAPDLLFVTGMSLVNGVDPYKPVSDTGVCVVYIPTTNSIAGIKEDIEFVGEVTGTAERAAELTADLDSALSEVAALGSTVTEKKSVLFEVAAAPQIYSFGRNVFLNEMLELIGARNIFEDEDSWISVSEESVISANPDVILTSVDYIEDPTGEILSRNGWENVTAVKNRQVYYIDTNSSSRPNQNIVKALWEMLSAVYPELAQEEAA
ncbi:MAG: ABC transporter substrate-binding protein [Clostridiales bacterium]|jgi:iron complex transport system substrate-binding protein|nr:ABC transporter substrate-binding protein [Clostridiales bacterium]